MQGISVVCKETVVKSIPFHVVIVTELCYIGILKSYDMTRLINLPVNRKSDSSTDPITRYMAQMSNSVLYKHAFPILFSKLGLKKT